MLYIERETLSFKSHKQVNQKRAKLKRAPSLGILKKLKLGFSRKSAMKKYTKIEPVEEGDCSCSPSLSLAPDPSLLREIIDRSTIIDWEQYYEKLYYQRSNRHLRRGLGRLQALCNDLLTRDQLLEQQNTEDSDDDDLDEEDADPIYTAELGELVEEDADPEQAEVSLEDHFVSTEISGNFTRICILCRCGAQHQLMVTGNECFLMISPYEDVSGEHHKLVWASNDGDVLLIGIDCSCGTGFLLKKSGPSILYAIR